jgi:hypothetical protein
VVTLIMRLVTPCCSVILTVSPTSYWPPVTPCLRKRQQPSPASPLPPSCQDLSPLTPDPPMGHDMFSTSSPVWSLLLSRTWAREQAATDKHRDTHTHTQTGTSQHEPDRHSGPHRAKQALDRINLPVSQIGAYSLYSVLLLTRARRDWAAVWDTAPWPLFFIYLTSCCSSLLLSYLDVCQTGCLFLLVQTCCV